MRRIALSLGVAVALGASAAAPAAPFGGTVVWAVGAGEFPDGTLDGLELRADGALRDGRAATAAQLDGADAGALARGSDGTLWVIAAAGAALWRVRGGQADRALAGADGERFTAVAAGRGGAVWVGVAGQGGLYYVTPSNAPVRFALEQGHVRALAVDGSGAAWAAVGAKGKPGRLVRVGPDGAQTALDRFEGPPPSQLAFDSTGGLWMLGHAGGRLERRAPDGTLVPAHDFGMELHRLARFGDGWAVAGGGTVWAVRPDGSVRRLDHGGGEVAALSAAGEGALAVARRGRVWLLRGDTRSLLLELPTARVTALAADGAGLRAVGCAGPGLCLELADGRRAGAWTSPVRDCGVASGAGRITLDASPGCTAEVRWGRTADPERGWSKWTAVDGAGALPAPARWRFLQLRIHVPEDGECRGATVSWLPDNRAPVVQASTRLVPRAGAGGRRDPVLFVEAGDADGDALLLEVRWTHAASGWTHADPAILLPAQQPARHRAAVPADLPDGAYWVEARASDAPDNTPERARSGVWRSAGPTLVVDRTKPVIGAVTVAGTTARVTVTDATSNVVRLEFALDDGGWTRLEAADGHCDARSEQAVVPLGTPSPGTHHLRVRATDARGNRAVTVTTFEVK